MDNFSNAEIMDNGQAVEVFCQSIVRVEDLGSNSRLYIAAHETTVGGSRFRTVVVRLIVPNEMLVYWREALKRPACMAVRSAARFRTDGLAETAH